MEVSVYSRRRKLRGYKKDIPSDKRVCQSLQRVASLRVWVPSRKKGEGPWGDRHTVISSGSGGGRYQFSEHYSTNSLQSQPDAIISILNMFFAWMVRIGFLEIAILLRIVISGPAKEWTQMPRSVRLSSLQHVLLEYP